MGRNLHPRGTPLKQRIRDRISIDNETGCWLWTGPLQPNGYAMMGIGRARRYVHRLAYSEWVGPIPAGLDMDHLCRVRKCCNPEHLQPVSRAENIRRGEGPAILAKINGAKTMCTNGHEFTEENTILRRGGGRKCRACSRSQAIRRAMD